MSRTNRGHYNANATHNQPPQKAKLSEVLSGIAQLMLQGSWPGTHAKILVESVEILETLANVERAREAQREKESGDEPAEVTEPEQAEGELNEVQTDENGL